ncbi:MAG: 5-formyltetrahydrofolate cyclo-ligase [Erythrobacter sp.]
MEKADLRKSLLQARRDHVAAQSDAIRALLFHRPPGPLLEHIPTDAVIGLYCANEAEAPAQGYAKFFHEAGHPIALPHFATSDASMAFREHTDPFGESDLEEGPFGIMQPGDEGAELIPDLLFVPLVGFTVSGERLGQGGGHYDRWLTAHPPRLAIGLAWDVQLCDSLPLEPHDVPLDTVVTPTRIYGLA